MAVAVASGNIRDSYWLYGKADLLARACTAGYVAGVHTDDGPPRDAEVVSAVPAGLLGLAVDTCSAGTPADFTLVRASSAQEAIVAQPPQRVVVKVGRVVAGGENDGVSPACRPRGR